MLFLMILVIYMQVTYSLNTYVGSTIFYDKHGKNECWNDDEIAKLRARRIFEQLIPSTVPPEQINGKYVKNILRYFRCALRTTQGNIDHHNGYLLKVALADTIGSHLRREILPTARYSYYAGYVPYRNVKELHDFLEHLKLILNTQGLGWARPTRLPHWSNLTVVKILVGSGKYLNPCSCLILKRDSNSCIQIPMPKLDNRGDPSAIALPFKSRGLVSLTSSDSENIVLKYYTTASRCILSKSPKKCRHTDFVNFNNELWHWMKRDVAPHLADEKLYAAFGGIIRIAAAVQSYGKGLSRRNVFEEEEGVLKWHPWKTLTDTYIYMDPDWTPKLYVLFVLLAAFCICLMQLCYGFIIGNRNECNCRGPGKKCSSSKVVAYANVESGIPALLPSHRSAIYYSDHKRVQRAPSRTKASSLGSIRTQKVYDLHENTEKMMAVIMSDNEDTSDTESPVPKQCESEDVTSNVLDVGETSRARSPPKLETSITEVKLERTPRSNRLQMCSTSTVTRSDMAYRQAVHATDSVWSESSTSAQSISSGSSKPRFRKMRSTRDLAWARRVASKASKSKSVSTNEPDVTSYTTPPSRR